MSQLDVFAEGCDEDDVAAFLNDSILPNTKTDPAYGPATGLMSSSSALMSQHLVPINPLSPYRVTQPKPDKLYGYLGSPLAVFTQQQMLVKRRSIRESRIIQRRRRRAFDSLFLPSNSKLPEALAATFGLPQISVGASSACLNTINQLNTSLQEYRSEQRVDNLSYCIAVDNNTTQLYISWKEADLTSNGLMLFSYQAQKISRAFANESEIFSIGERTRA